MGFQGSDLFGRKSALMIGGKHFRVGAGIAGNTGGTIRAHVTGERILKFLFAVVRRHSPLLY
jgi:hypothetical protein